MLEPLHILIAEDNPADAMLELRALRQAGFAFKHQLVDTEEDYLRHLNEGIDVILSDYEMPQFGALRALQLRNERGLEIPFIIVSGTIGEDLAVSTIKQGASDYLLKDRLTRLGPAIEQALEKSRLRKERRKAEQELRESEARFRQLAESIQEVFWLADIERRQLLYVSPAYEAIWGRSCQELYITPDAWLEAMHPEDRERVVSSALAQQLKGIYDEEYRIVRPDGSIRWVRDRAFPVATVPGHVDRVAGIARDITERKLAEMRVHEQAAMLNLAHDAIIVRNFGDRRVTFWNQGAERLYGWTSAEALGRDLIELISVDVDPLDVEQALVKTENWQGESRQLSKDGKKLVVSTRATLVRDAKGQPAHVLVINADITEQKALEAKFLRAQRMESIGTLASGLAHDLNNVLAPILMSIPLLRRDLPPKQREEVVNTVHMSATRGAEIVKQVLAFGRGLESSRHPLDAGAIIAEIAKIVFQTFPKDIELFTSVDHDLWHVVGDATQLHQVLLNLCVNARDAMPGGGKLFLEARNLLLDENYASMLPGATVGPNVLLEVRDTGTGIPPEIIERIFDPFFTTKSVGSGTGLGLSSVVGIVKNHGGHIGVSSDVGAGTTFQIHLPALRSEDYAPDDAETQSSLPLGNGEWLLLVDDEAAVRRAAQIVLEAHGYHVITATDGAEALSAFMQHVSKIALVLTDLMMPHLDGVGFIQALRRLAPRIPILVSTGLEKKAQTNQLRSLKVHAIINKPYGADVLLANIREALQDAPAPSP